MNTPLILIGSFVFLVAFGIILGVSYNSFIEIKAQVEESFATMDVYLKKRFDLIPNLVNTVKGYGTHEKETLENVIRMRNIVGGATSIEERQQSEDMLSNTLKSLFAVTENYPELRADQGFINLQTTLNQIEMDIAQSRKYYNAVVKAFNVKVERFPSNIMASIFGFREYPYFQASGYERQNVTISF